MSWDSHFIYTRKLALMAAPRYVRLARSSYATARGHGLSGVANRPLSASSAAILDSTSGCVAMKKLHHRRGFVCSSGVNMRRNIRCMCANKPMLSSRQQEHLWCNAQRRCSQCPGHCVAGGVHASKENLRKAETFFAI